ncbi:MAG: Plug domain-containing protein, partial [Steroidobacteraceae bacterium]
MTAQRRSEDLQTTAVAVTAVSAEDLFERGVTTIKELSSATPGLHIGATAGGNPATPHLAIRGQYNRSKTT